MPTYHVELRNFPRVETRFNQSGEQVGAIVLLWVQDEIVELNDEKWAPWESQITIIEGPPIPLGGISMGRGWPKALREGSNVTDRVLAEARQALAEGNAGGGAAMDATPAEPAPVPAEDHPNIAADAPEPAPTPSASKSPPREGLPVGVELAGLLGAEPGPLLLAWRSVAARTSGLSPSESLALAERELRTGHNPPR